MYVLDSDAFSYLNRYGQQKPLGRRVAAVSDPTVVSLTIITVEEALEGRLKQIRDNRNASDLPEYYAYLDATFGELKKYQILPYSKEANTIYRQIPKNIRKDRVHDCRIASIAVAFEATIITMNVKEDFSRIKEALPALRFEDWTITST